MLQWSSTGPGPQYRYQVDTVNTFDSPNEFNGTTTMNYINIWFPLNETTYYWHVQSYNSIDMWGPYSSTWYFTVDITPPAIPTLQSPTPLGYLHDDWPTLEWNDDPDVYRYYVQVSNSSNFDTLIVDVETLDNFYVFSTPLTEGQWHWRVRARDYAYNYCNWTSTYFTIDTTPPGIPVLETPDNLAVIGTAQPLLEWSSIEAVLYQVQVSDIMNFSTLTFNITTVDNFYSISSPLDDGIWYWRVRAKDAAGNWGYWSAIWWFKIETIVVPELMDTNILTLLIMTVFLFSLVVITKRKK
jgi:hypothetical protein